MSTEVTTPKEIETDADAAAAAIAELGIDPKTVKDPIEKSEARTIKPIPPVGKKDEKEPVKESKAPASSTPSGKGEEAPVKEAAKTDEDENWAPTAEDLAAIEANPLLKKAYKSMNRGFQGQVAKVAERRKALEGDADLLSKVKTNPRAAIEALASVAGISLKFEEPAAAPEDPLADAEAELAKVVTPEGAKALRPALVKIIEAVTGQKIKPIEQTLEQSQKATMAARVDAAVRSYGASKVEGGEEWNPEISSEVTKLVGVVVPGKIETREDLNNYLDILYDRVMAVRTRSTSRKATLDRLRAATEQQEPVHGSRPSKQTEETITDDMDEKTANRVAVAQALKELELR